MNHPQLFLRRVVSIVRLLALILVFATLAASALRSPCVEADSAIPIRVQATSAFSSVGDVKQVTMAGTVTTYSGSMSDTGKATITAGEDGSGRLTLNLGREGTHTETLDPTSSNRNCTWSGADGIPHDTGFSLCAAPLHWYLPDLVLQSGNADTTATDDGIVDVDGKQLRVLRVSSLSSGRVLSASKMPAAIMTLGLDPVSLLPVILKYSIHPDDNPATVIRMEVTYSDYSAEQGLQIPHLIQRRLNGALVTSLQIQTVSVP